MVLLLILFLVTLVVVGAIGFTLVPETRARIAVVFVVLILAVIGISTGAFV